MCASPPVVSRDLDNRVSRSQRPPPSRLLALDVARALAILGMILVNFRAMSAPDDLGARWLEWPIDRIEGKAAALFVVLAGVGLSLRARSWAARRSPRATLQHSLLRRAAVLFGLGLLNLHVWEWDILHCYGVFLFVGAALLYASDRELLLSGAFLVGIAIGLQAVQTEAVEFDFWSPLGALLDMTSVGLFPFFPWGVFLLFGLWLGRLDLRQGLGGRAWWLGAAAVVIVFEVITVRLMPTHDFDQVGLSWNYAVMAWPRPAGPAFLLSGLCASYLVVRACVAAELRWRETAAFDWLARTGRLSLSIYLVHAWAIMIADTHAWFPVERLDLVTAYALAVFAVCGIAAGWWTRRFDHGPVELIVRQLSDPPPAQDAQRAAVLTTT